MGLNRTTMVLVATCAMVAAVVAGCARNPGEDYEDTTIRQLIASPPGLYEIYSTAQNPIDIVVSGENWVVLRQGKDMIIAGGDTLEARLPQFHGQDYSIIGRRMGQPKLWFAVDGIVQDEQMALQVKHSSEARKEFPAYESFNSEAVEEFTPIDLAEFDYDKQRAIRDDLLNKKVRITGNLVSEELDGGVKRWLVESRNISVELQPIGNNLRYFLEMNTEVGAPFVAYGELTDILTWDDGSERDRESTHIAGPFRVEMMRYGADILVRNII
ncbi:MAG: hypothetical protein PVF43_08415 [Candidatus Eiseniibacteriota bacterium]|jgi:hypothetical protein